MDFFDATIDKEGRLLVGYDDGEANRGVSRVARPQTNTDQPRPPDHGPSEVGQRFDVRATTVDLLTAACPQVDVVKIDVEGAEDMVLEGMHAGLSARRYRALVLELHPDLLRARRVDPASCVARMREYGYRGWTIDLGPDTYRRALDPAVDVTRCPPARQLARHAVATLLWPVRLDSQCCRDRSFPILQQTHGQARHQLASDRAFARKNRPLRLNHWPIWIAVFFIAPG